MKVIIFDNNGVLTTSDDERTYNELSKFLGVAINDVKKLFEPYVRDLDTGKITQNEFYFRILRDTESGLSVEQFRKVHLNSYIAKPEMQELAMNVKKNYKIALLTNFGDAFWSMFDTWGFHKLFSKEEVFLSAELGMAKPDKEIYRYVLKKLGIKAEDAIFIDDNEKNIHAASELGINAVLFRGIDSLNDSLKKLGIIL